MEEILIHANGEIRKGRRVVTTSVLRLLGNHIRMDKNFTLQSFFTMVGLYPDLINISEMLEPLLEIVSENSNSGYKIEEIDSLIFYKTIEIKGFPGSPSIFFYNMLKGVSNHKTKDLKFFQLESLLGHKVTLGKLKHVVFGDKEDVFQYDTFYTLFEFVEGIAWELSFNFNPLECSIRG